MNSSYSQTTLSEKETLLDLLTTQKGLITGYTSAIMEMSDEQLRGHMSQNLTETFRDQYGIFINMNSRGYYPLQMADVNEVQQACRQFSQIGQQL